MLWEEYGGIIIADVKTHYKTIVTTVIKLYSYTKAIQQKKSRN